jgi:hypothetical protein
MTSPDGITWTTRTSAADNIWHSVCWSPELYLFCVVAPSGTGNRVMTTLGNHVNTSTTIVNYTNSRGLVGIGKGPTSGYQLDLSADTARKLTTTTWSTGSDYRIKKNIEDADIDRCYEISSTLKLKYFEWDNSINTTDKHSIGFIAQEVKEVFPNAVKISSETLTTITKTEQTVTKQIEEADENGQVVTKDVQVTEIVSTPVSNTISDFHTLNVDQLYKVMWGTIQKLQQQIEELETELETLNS